MPARDKAVQHMANRALKAEGKQGLHWVYGEFAFPYMEQAWDAAQIEYEAWVDAVDWNRVMIQAASRCMSHGHETSDWTTPCGDCIREQLLSHEH